jgi:hypothetical protein
METVLIVAFIALLVFGLFGAWVAEEKGRSGIEGFFLGLLFGPLGVLVEALLPVIQNPTPPVLSREEREFMETEQRLREHEQRKRSEEIARQSEFRRAERARLRSERWEATPDWVKMALVGLLAGTALSLPLFMFLPSSHVPEPEPQALVIPGIEAQADANLAKDKQETWQDVRSRILVKVPEKPIDNTSASKSEELDPQLEELVEQANRFAQANDLQEASLRYKIIVEDYPGTPQAKEAAEKLSRIETSAATETK